MPRALAQPPEPTTTVAETPDGQVPAANQLPPPPPVIAPPAKPLVATAPITDHVPIVDGRNSDDVIVANSTSLDVVPVASLEFEEATARRDALVAALADANQRITATAEHAAVLETDRVATSGLLERAGQRRVKLAARLEIVESALRSVSVQRYVHGASDDLYPDPNSTVEEALDRSHRITLAFEAERTLIRDGTAMRTSLDGVIAQVDEHTARLETIAEDYAETARRNAQAVLDATKAVTAITGAEQEVRDSRANTMVAGSDLPLVALDAYWRASVTLSMTQPTCGISWWALAGVGRTESNHGRAGGGMARTDGVVTVGIYGIPLDGTNNTRLIGDSDQGQLDLDTLFDRAVGPMQFIPGTWNRWATDGSGDGIADPQNLYDGAMAAGNYLCNYGPGLDGIDGLRRAYFGYNRSDAYVANVLARSLAYALLPVPDSLLPGLSG